VNTITAHRGKRGIAPLNRMETNGQAHTQAALPSEEVPLVPIHSTLHNVSILTTPSWLLPPTALYTMSIYWLHHPDSCHPKSCTQCQYTDYTILTPAIQSAVHNVNILTTPSWLLPSKALYTTCTITTRMHIISQFANNLLSTTPHHSSLFYSEDGNSSW
jgi:hypothetical protein